MNYLLKDISKSFEGKRVLDHLDLTIKENEVNALVGPSGSGKTTLLRIIMGFVIPDSGDLSALKGKRFSAVFQEDRLCENLSAVSNVRLVANDKAKVIQALRQVGLENSLQQPVRELSGGMKRRVALVRALLADYDLLLLDEPFKGLDEGTKDKIIAYTRLMCKGKTVILVTHDIEEAKKLGMTNLITLEL